MQVISTKDFLEYMLLKSKKMEDKNKEEFYDYLLKIESNGITSEKNIFKCYVDSVEADVDTVIATVKIYCN